MSATFRTIIRDGVERQILWVDKFGVTHKCEGSDVHPGVRLIWTLCEKDVPANQAFLPGDGDHADCVVCRWR